MMAVKKRQQNRYLTIGIVYIATIVSQGEFFNNFLLVSLELKLSAGVDFCLFVGKASLECVKARACTLWNLSSSRVVFLLR